jgi:hypothetical protein
MQRPLNVAEGGGARLDRGNRRTACEGCAALLTALTIAATRAVTADPGG